MKCRYCPREVDPVRAAKLYKSCGVCGGRLANRKRTLTPDPTPAEIEQATARKRTNIVRSSVPGLRAKPALAVVPARQPVTLIEMADAIIRSGPGWVGAQEDDDE